jgi:hypothetical protein
LVAETGLEPASTDYEFVPGGFTTPVYSASTFQTCYGGRIRTYVNEFQRLAPFQLGHSVRIFELVDLARFERATSTFAESRSNSPELQVRELAEAAGLEPAHAVRGDLANRCHTVRRRLRRNFELRISDCGMSDKLQLVAGSVKSLFPKLTTS